MERNQEESKKLQEKSTSRKRSVLIVGAGGFAGGHIAEEALRRGLDVTAGVRHSTSRRWLSDTRLHFLELDFDNPESLAGSISAAMEENGGKWDWIVYNLGATKCLSFLDFNRINYIYLKDFTTALQKAGAVPEKLLYISSLSAMGKGDEKGYTPFREDMVPAPDTRYGTSKLKAETWLATSGIPHIIFRATGLYGPRDRDYFLMFESIARGFDFSVGFRRQELTFLYIDDLCRAIFDALEKSETGTTYNVSEPRTYTQKEFRSMAAEAIGRRHVFPMRLPLWMVKIACAISEKIGVARGKPSTLNTDKYKILAQRNWAVDTERAVAGFGFHPEIDLKEGIRRSVEWYRKEGWLK